MYVLLTGSWKLEEILMRGESGVRRYLLPVPFLPQCYNSFMKFAYPASNSIDDLSQQQTALKISRHCACTICGTCKGLHPSIGVHVVLDDGSGESSLGDLGQYGSDDDDDGASVPPYLDICACGHSVADHGANELKIGVEEYRRRALYAIRIDENLQV